MNTTSSLVRPASLEPGKVYILKERNESSPYTGANQVRLLDYCPCPAVIIVIFQMTGEKRRCLREEVFEQANISAGIVPAPRG